MISKVDEYVKSWKVMKTGRKKEDPNSDISLTSKYFEIDVSEVPDD